MQHTQVKNQQNKARMKNLRDILDQAKQSIDVIKSEHSTRTFARNFQKSTGETNIYVQFGYGLLKYWCQFLSFKI